MSELADIKKRMNELEILIKETKDRLPAHSTKPPVMFELLEYEDEYDMLLKKLNKLKGM
ncbi:MAG: hypothetical protein PF690_07170 [Deltaproteobacteria bacterium]|jgi:hypothetical protein|nr:hypothetical protein [Deltaproteobacteria bacterium]